MLPPRAIHDTGDAHWRDAKLFGKHGAADYPWNVSGSDLQNLLIGEFGRWGIFSCEKFWMDAPKDIVRFSHSALANCIRDVLLMRASKEVGWVAAGWIIARMKNVQRSRINSSGEKISDSMNKVGSACQLHLPIAIAVRTPSPRPTLDGCTLLDSCVETYDLFLGELRKWFTICSSHLALHWSGWLGPSGAFGAPLAVCSL